ncbi:MAG: hypothetical protein WCI05_14990 [Myxococcales bacterium]|jgi:hypothetical protein
MWQNIRRAFLVLTAFGASLPLFAQAHAEAKKPQGTVLVLLGSKTDAGAIDPKIGILPQLNRPPLNTYNTYRLLGRGDGPLETGRPLTVSVAGGARCALSLLETKEQRFHFRAEIAAPNNESRIDVTTGPGEYVFIGGKTFGDGALFCGFQVKP